MPSRMCMFNLCGHQGHSWRSSFVLSANIFVFPKHGTSSCLFWLTGFLKVCFREVVGKSYLFGFEIKDFQDLRTYPETSGSDLSPDGHEVWPGSHIWHKKWNAVLRGSTSTAADTFMVKNEDLGRWAPPNCRSRSEVSFKRLKTPKYAFPGTQISIFMPRTPKKIF